MMKSESAWLGIVRICLRVERMSKHITAEANRDVSRKKKLWITYLDKREVRER